MACNQPPEESKIRDCTSFVQFEKESNERLEDFKSKNLIWKKTGKDEASKIFRPLFVQMMTMWKKYVHDLFKETVEALVHHAKISKSCKPELLGKCDQISPIFSGDGGIDFAFSNIFKIQKPLSVVILESGPVNYDHISYQNKNRFVDNHSLTTAEILNDLLCLYHGVYCVFSDQDPEVFDKLDGELFDSPDKHNFQRVFGEIPGDFLHILHKYVKENKKEAYIYPLTLINFNRFINALADALRKAISTVVQDMFDIQIW